MSEENIEINEFGEEERVVETEMMKCPGCGANMVFDPDKHALVCPHCETVKNIEDQGTAFEKMFSEAVTENSVNAWKETEVFRCTNCGAKVVLKKGETATKCPFCVTAHVQKTEELAGVKPNAVLPFAFGEEKAIELSKAWAKKRLFAPRKFKKHISSENLSGIYAPAFTFDSQTVSYYKGKIGIRHTRTVGSGKNKRTQTWVEWRHISGVYNHFFDDILIASGSNFDQKKTDKLSPFDTNSSTVYEEKYLLGFSAYGYDKDISQCWGEAKGKMDATIRRKILSKYHYDELAYLNVSTTHSSVTYKYVMLPVYVGNYKFSSKLYNFFVNGSTGKVWGKTPKSPIRVGLAVLFGIAIVVGIILLAKLSR